MRSKKSTRARKGPATLAFLLLVAAWIVVIDERTRYLARVTAARTVRELWQEARALRVEFEPRGSHAATARAGHYRQNGGGEY